MTFRSDRKALRTFDADRGWELLHKYYSTGEIDFLLEHNCGDKLHFRGFNTESIKVGVDNSGCPLFLKKWTIFGIRLKPNEEGDSPFSMNQQKDLIEEALYAFGTIHEGPNGPIEVTYE